MALAPLSAYQPSSQRGSCRNESRLSLWVGVFLCFANGWLLYLILSRLMPRATLVPVLAAVFLVVHRADPLRFFVMWASNHYQSAPFDARGLLAVLRSMSPPKPHFVGAFVLGARLCAADQ